MQLLMMESESILYILKTLAVVLWNLVFLHQEEPLPDLLEVSHLLQSEE